MRRKMKPQYHKRTKAEYIEHLKVKHRCEDTDSYPRERIGGGNPYYKCSSCGASDPQINGKVQNHFSFCHWVHLYKTIQGMELTFDKNN